MAAEHHGIWRRCSKVAAANFYGDLGLGFAADVAFCLTEGRVINSGTVQGRYGSAQGDPPHIHGKEVRKGNERVMVLRNL
jgi:hypothetical protein